MEDGQRNAVIATQSMCSMCMLAMTVEIQENVECKNLFMKRIATTENSRIKAKYNAMCNIKNIKTSE